MAPVAGVTTDVSSAHMAEIEIPILGLNVQALAPPEAWATIWKGDGSWVKNWRLLMKTGFTQGKVGFHLPKKGEIIDR